MKKLNLYLIYQDVNNDYDTYYSAVVAATSDDDAKNIHPSGYDNWELAFGVTLNWLKLN